MSSNFPAHSIPGDTQEDQSRHAIAVIDFEQHTRGGHFGPWLAWFVTEFSRRFETVLVFTPNGEGTGEYLDRTMAGGKPAHISCHNLPLGPRKRFWRLKRKKCSLAQVFRKAKELAPGQSLSGYVMWGYDLDPRMAESVPGVNWGTVGSTSASVRGHTKASQIVKEKALRALCEEHPGCRCLLVPDRYTMPEGEGKLLWIPGYENTELPPEPTPIAKAIREFAGDKMSVGVFGMLTGTRCVNELLLLLQRQPDVRFVMVGHLDPHSVREDLRPLLDAAKPENLLLIPGFLEKESDLNAAIQATDATLLDGVNQCAHSGIATKALFYGRYLVTPHSNSWVQDVIEEYGVGLAYEKHDVDLPRIWKTWLDDGGADKAKQAAAGLMGPEKIATTFDTLVQRLKGVA